MKKGDIVRVTRLTESDRKETALQIGHTGVIVRKYSFATQNPIYDVKFGPGRVPLNAFNATPDGSYSMFADQLELIRK